jgi:hypothetical protein
MNMQISGSASISFDSCRINLPVGDIYETNLTNDKIEILTGIYFQEELGITVVRVCGSLIGLRAHLLSLPLNFLDIIQTMKHGDDLIYILHLLLDQDLSIVALNRSQPRECLYQPRLQRNHPGAVSAS